MFKSNKMDLLNLFSNLSTAFDILLCKFIFFPYFNGNFNLLEWLAVERYS